MVNNAGDAGLILVREDPLKKEMATHSSIIAWRIPWIEESDQLQCTGDAKSRTRLKYLTLSLMVFLGL